MSRTGNFKIIETVGAGLRRQFRRELDKIDGITYTESKGLLDSQFVIRGHDEAMYNALMTWLTKLHKQFS